MADVTIQPDEQGAYELALEGGAVMTVEILTPTPTDQARVQVLIHAADAPVYVRRGSQVEPRDPKAIIITAGAWAEVAVGETQTIAIISETDATVSVARA